MDAGSNANSGRTGLPEPSDASGHARPPIRKWRVFMGVFGLGFICILVFSALFSRDLLVIAADQWIIDDPFDHADAVFVLGGGVNTRPFEAARLYRRGQVKQVLYARGRLQQTDILKLHEPDYLLMEKVIRKLGVPDEKVAVVGSDVTSTYEEAVALRNWAQTNHIKSVVIPTGDFHTRRVRFIFNRVLADDDLKVFVTWMTNRFYDHDTWWTHERGLITFQNEVVKYLLYRLRY